MITLTNEKLALVEISVLWWMVLGTSIGPWFSLYTSRQQELMDRVKRWHVVTT